jgi:hypothetical protein
VLVCCCNFLLFFSCSAEEPSDGGFTPAPSSSPSGTPTDEPSSMPSSSPTTTQPTTHPTAATTITADAGDTEEPMPDNTDAPVDPDIDGDGTPSDPDTDGDGTPSDPDTDAPVDSDIDGDVTVLDPVTGEEDPLSNGVRGVDNVGDDNSDLGTGPVIGIAAAAAACLLCCLLVACRRRNDDDTEPHKELHDLESDGSAATEGSPDLKFFSGYQMDAMADTGDRGSVTSSQKSFNKRSVLQFDPTTAAAIAMGKRGEDSSSARSSFFNRSRVSGAASVEQITKAIDKANWDEVYNLASQMAEQEDLSTLSSVGRHNSKLASSSSELDKIRNGLSAEDQERTRALDELVDHGDWTGVAVTAALYAGESGSSGENPLTQRSILDILTGKRGTSSAAAAATEQDTLSALPVPFGNALGTFTDDTRSGTTDEPGSFDLYSPSSSSQPVPSSPVLRALTTPSPPPKTKRSRGALPAETVTAFSSSSSVSPSVQTSASAAALGPLKGDIDRAVEAGDWVKVLMLSSEVESNEAYQANVQAPSTPARDSNAGITPERASASGDAEKSKPTVASLQEELNGAVYHGDWALVTFLADRIMLNRREGTDQDASASTSSSAIVPQSTALVPVGLQAARSTDTSDTEASKKNTIEKLVLAEKWKGVSIMAGLYDMELKGSLPTGDVQSRALVQSDTMTVHDSPTVQSTWMGGLSAGSTESKDSQDAGTAVSDGKSAGWTDILNRSHEAITPQKPKSPDNQIMSPPPQIKREEIHLRKVAGNVPDQSENVELQHASLVNRNIRSDQLPPTELRHADRVTGDIPSSQLPAAQLRETAIAEKVVKRDSQNRASLHGARNLIPYWKTRGDKNASDDAKPSAK